MPVCVLSLARIDRCALNGSDVASALLALLVLILPIVIGDRSPWLLVAAVGAALVLLIIVARVCLHLRGRLPTDNTETS